MRKQLISLFLSGLMATSSFAFADKDKTFSSKKSMFEPQIWNLSGSNDVFTIQNASGNYTIAVLITVNYHYENKNPSITIKNCGNITHADPTHPAICYNSNASEPISFTLNNNVSGVTGTYQIDRF
jgi:hypothetical protein